jgi:hypothetical protein
MVRKTWRRVERFGLGVVFGFAAWFIERRVLKAIRKKGESPPKLSSMADHTTSEVEKPRA